MKKACEIIYILKMYDVLLSKANELSKVKDLLRDSIKELLMKEKREKFIKEQYPDLANALLRRVAVDWISCFDKKDRIELFESIFVDISIAPLPESIIALAAGLKRQMELRNEGSRVAECKRLGVVSSVLRKVITKSNIEALIRCLYQRNKTWHSIQYKAMEGALIQVIVSLPDRTRNAEESLFRTSQTITEKKTIIPNVKIYFSRICKALFSELRDTNSVDVAACWISKLCMIGQSKIVASSWIETFVLLSSSSSSSSSLNTKSLHCDVLSKLRSGTLEYLAREMIIELVDKSKKEQGFVLNGLFLREMLREKSSFLRTILSNRMLRGGGRWCVSCDAIRLVVDMLASCEKKVFHTCLQTCMDAWSDTSFSKNGGYLAQRHIVVAVVRYLHHARNEVGRSPHVSAILKGVQLRLDSSRHRIRKLSMIVATRFSESLSNTKSSTTSLRFDDCDLSVKEISEMLDEKDDELIEKNVLFQFEKTKEEAEKENEEEDRGEEGEEEEEDEIDPDKPVFKNNNIFETQDLTAELLKAEVHRQIEQDTYDEYDEYDSDDSEASMEEYDTSDYSKKPNDEDIDFKPTKVPTFLRDCIDVLHKNDNAQLMSETLANLPSLIEKSRSDDVHTMAAALLKALLHLDDKYAMPDFSRSCYQSSVKITVASPSRCLRVLIDETFGPERSVGDRISSLSILGGAARTLSSLSEDQVTKTKERKNQSSKIVPVGKSRRWGSGRRDAIPSQANRFAPLAGDFFFSLSSQFGRPFRSPDGIASKASMLTSGFELILIRYVETLGLLIRCARLSSSNPKMCSTMVRIALALRYHENADVRLAVLHSIFCIIEACDVNKSVYDVIAQDVTELLVWIELCAAGDSNLKCREESQAIRELLQHCDARLSRRHEKNNQGLLSKIKAFSSSKPVISI